MRLTDLDPRWFDFGGHVRAGFVFHCPHCPQGTTYLVCKRIAPMQVVKEQIWMIAGLFPDIDARELVAARKDFAWSISGDFDNLTVTPSIDASVSGHWHGFITNGEIK